MSIVEQRAAFVADYHRDVWSMTELCARYAVARKTGYKWLGRHDAAGVGGLADQSRCPQRCPSAVGLERVAAIVACRAAHPRWGPRKLRAVLHREQPDQVWPARSTIAKILKDAGLVEAHRRRPAVPVAPRTPRLLAAAPNDIWTIDFKGQFRTGDGVYCYPLTVLDRFSRFVLDCHGMRIPTARETQQRLRRLFQEFGLPAVLRSDNGTPFASTGLAGLSTLAVWWLRLGIQLDRITPGHPQENGSHERFHRTLKAETARPPAATLAAQQHRFDAHRHEYNQDRPHEALGDARPADHYIRSPRPFPATLPPVQYPGYYEVRRVGSNGCVYWHRRATFLSAALEGEDVGFEPVDDGHWVIHLATQPIARFDERRHRVTPAYERLTAGRPSPATWSVA